MLHRQTHTQIGAQRQCGQQFRQPNALACGRHTHQANLPRWRDGIVATQVTGNDIDAPANNSHAQVKERE